MFLVCKKCYTHHVLKAYILGATRAAQDAMCDASKLEN
jgi:hypothetical protein